jgi:hypothetical protein
MPGGGPEDIFIWGGHQKCINHLGGTIQKISKKVGGAPKIMYNNHKISAIIHCNINVNAI